MSNFTFTIDYCTITAYASKSGKGWGRMLFEGGTSNFDEKFETISEDVIKLLQDNKNTESAFKVTGTKTKNLGYGQYEGREFTKYLITEIELVDAVDAFNARRFIDEAISDQANRF